MGCPLVLADPTQCEANGNPLGLPADPSPSYTPLGLQPPIGIVADGSAISPFQRAWEATESFYTDIYGGAKKVIGTVYTDVRGGVGTVYDDVSKPITSAVTGTYWYLLIGVAVLGVIVVMTAKSGAIKVNAGI